MPGHPFESGFDLTIRPERLQQPLAWKKPRMIFVNSMSDLFHKEVPKEHIGRVFDTMEQADWHIYQVLTKRSSLLQKFINERYKQRVRLRTSGSVSQSKTSKRLPESLTSKKPKPASASSPWNLLLRPLASLNLAGIDWVIVGGESGPRARPMKPEWARSMCEINAIKPAWRSFLNSGVPTETMASAEQKAPTVVNLMVACTSTCQLEGMKPCATETLRMEIRRRSAGDRCA